MLVLVTYDVNTESEAGKKRLRKVAKICQNYGIRVQNSVFECVIQAEQWVTLRAQLVNEIDEKHDSLRFYFLGNNWKKRLEHIGAKPTIDLEGFLIA
jgi:CRISPR-associated protein Cas2